MEPQYVGIDPSLSRTAIIHGGAKYGGVRIFKSEPNGPAVASRMMRFATMASAIRGHLNNIAATCGPIRLVCIESYSLGHNNPGTASLCEFGGILRLRLTEAFRLVECSPSKLKQFVSGKGNTKKPEFISTLARRYDVAFPDEDEYFAYGLWLIARSAMEPQLGTKEQATIAAKVMNPKPKTKKNKGGHQVAE